MLQLVQIYQYYSNANYALATDKTIYDKTNNKTFLSFEFE